MASDRKFSDLELERALAHDLPARRAAELDRDATAADRARLAELRATHQAFLATTDVGAEVAAIGRRVAQHAPPRPRAWLRWSMPLGALAAAAVVALIVTRPAAPPPIVGEADLQTKGDGIALVVHVATGAVSRPLRSGDTVQPGAHVRFEVRAPRRGFVAVIGVSDGVATVYYPFGGHIARELVPSAGALLPGAIALDASTADERFVAVYAEEPFELDTVVRAVRDRTALAGLTMADIVLHKSATLPR